MDSTALEGNFCENIFGSVISAGNNIYDINNIGAIILPECIFILANKEVDTTI